MKTNRAAPRRGTYIFGILDAGASLAKELFAEERQEDAQVWSAGENTNQRLWAMGESQKARDFEERMANTRYQRGRQDLEAAGFNPMMAWMNSAAPMPSGHPASAGVAGSAGIASPGGSTSIAAGQQAASQIEVNEALAERTRAEAKEIEARTPVHAANIREIEARIPKHDAEVASLQQQVSESAVRIEKIWEETRVLGHTASNIQQQTTNLIETIPQIRANIAHLKALADKESAASSEIKQRVRQDLPSLEATLSRLEATAERLKQPGQANQAAAADSFIGQLGAYVRQLTGIGIIAIPGRSAPRSTTIINQRR